MSESGSAAIERFNCCSVMERTRAQSVLPFLRSVNRLVVLFPLIAPRYSGRDQPPILTAPGEHHGDHKVLQPANREKPFLAVVGLSGRNFQHRGIPNPKGVFKVDSMGAEICPAFVFVPLELHPL